LNGEPVAAGGKVWKIDSTFDQLGNDTQDSYFGVDGKPALGADCYATIRKRYDVYGNVTEENYFGIDGHPIDSEQGYAKAISIYDLRGRVVQKSLAKADGEPILVDDIGVKAVYNYNDDDVITGVAYVDAQGQQIPTWVKVDEVQPGTTAERIGLAPGDHLVSYDGTKLLSTEQVIAITRASEAGEHVLDVQRGTRILTIRIPAGRIGVILETMPADRNDN
jgi:membrane-associated protease RseP (regulator of RpoE activity)